MSTPVTVQAGPPSAAIQLPGDLVVPRPAYGCVLFAHGSGSSRHSPRNRAVARTLQERGFATVLLDLLTPDEERLDQRSGELRFDIGLLSDRLVAAVDQVHRWELTGELPLGVFGASTGAASALVAAAERPTLVGAVVSRGGRPDLAGADVLRRVQAPTLLVVGGDDRQVLTLNEEAAGELTAAYEIQIVPGASHLFEEPGTLQTVAELAAAWFERHLRARTT